MPVHSYELVPVESCYMEIAPILLAEHWAEVGHYKDIPIDMEWPKYFALQESGKLRCYLIRGHLNEEHSEQVLMGYAFYIVDEHLHYRTTKVAMQDILYVRKPYRGIGRAFLTWCDEQLRAEGVVTVTHHVKPWYDFSSMLERLGYEKAETIYSRRL
jgi:GNAT superfamily N-acetyltransferase